MEPNKFEKEFRNKLNQREISPSENSWDRLDAMLTATEEKKPKRGHTWMYVAASFVGFLLMATFYFSQKGNTIENQKVVMENNRKVESKKEVLSVISSDSKSETVVVVSEEKQGKKNSRVANSIIANQVEQNSSSDSSVLAVGQKEDDQEKEQFVSSNISDNAIDEMLAAVKTTSKTSNSKTEVKINPNTLLSQVDGELELSFREKVINKVNKNYQTVKVALANRNQE